MHGALIRFATLLHYLLFHFLSHAALFSHFCGEVAHENFIAGREKVIARYLYIGCNACRGWKLVDRTLIEDQLAEVQHMATAVLTLATSG
jgi:hypothetical protein